MLFLKNVLFFQVCGGYADNSADWNLSIVRQKELIEMLS